MIFRYTVEIEIKNDGLTQDADPNDLAQIVLHNLEDNKLDSLPWVIRQHYHYNNGY
jgi:hypothetical protein